MPNPSPGSYWKHFQTGKVHQVLFVAEDQTRPIGHQSVVFIPLGGKTQPIIRRLTNFLEYMAPGLSRFMPCDKFGNALPDG